MSVRLRRTRRRSPEKRSIPGERSIELGADRPGGLNTGRPVGQRRERQRRHPHHEELGRLDHLTQRNVTRRQEQELVP